MPRAMTRRRFLPSPAALLGVVAALVALPAWPLYRAQARAERVLAERDDDLF